MSQPAKKRHMLGRDFWLYFGGQLTSQLGSSFTLFALPLLVFKLTHSPTNLALTTASDMLPYPLFGLVLGAMVDRVNRKRMMLLTDIARGCVILVLPALALSGTLRVQVIYGVAFLQSTLGILFDCGEFAAIPSLVGRDDLVAANGRIMATNSAGQVLGPILAGVLVTLLSPANLLFFDGASFFVSAAALAVIGRSFNAPNPRAPSSAGISGLFADVWDGLRYVWSHPVLRSISIMMALINFVGATENSQLVLFAKRVLGASDSQVALLFAAGAAGVVVVSLAAAPIRRRLTFAVTALGALVISGIAVTAMALIGSYPAALVLWGMSAGFGLLLNINTGSLRQAIVPSHLYGRIISVAGVLAWSAIPLGALAGAAAIQLSGSVAGVYAVTGCLTAVIALLFAFSPVRHGDRYLAEAAAKAAAPPDAAVATSD
ncbi:MAG: MFS transporter [Actinobacteria bacterium]|nr:MFS transporter [Actinomycetota bacterium]